MSRGCRSNQIASEIPPPELEEAFETPILQQTSSETPKTQNPVSKPFCIQVSKKPAGLDVQFLKPGCTRSSHSNRGYKTKTLNPKNPKSQKP